MTLRDFINSLCLPPDFEMVVNGIMGNDFFVGASILDEVVTNWTIVKNTIVVFTTAMIEPVDDEDDGVDSFDEDEVIPVDIDKILQ